MTMNTMIQGVTSLGGRIMIATIFLLSAVGNKIPQFNALAGYMASEGVPAPQLMLVGAIVFLIVGSISLVLGFKARVGAVLLLAFLVLATYYFHDFWNFSGADRQNQMIQFMKNLSMMGTMLFVVANGPGTFSLDRHLVTVDQKNS
jgi:putative oxidoreductase